MKFTSPLISDASASLGGATFVGGRSGTMLRKRVAPLQPRTVAQAGLRASFASTTAVWGSLSPTEVAGWNAAAINVTQIDKLGHPYHPSGQQLFSRCNLNLSYAGLPAVTSSPIGAPSFPALTGSTLAAVTTAGALTTLLLTLPPAAAPLSANLIAALTPGLSPGISNVQRWRYRRLTPPYAGSTPPPPITIGLFSPGQGTGGGVPQTVFTVQPLPAGALTKFQIHWSVAPLPGQQFTVHIGTPSGSDVTITDSFTVNTTPTTGTQTYSVGSSFSPRSVAAGQLFGVSMATGTGYDYEAGYLSYEILYLVNPAPPPTATYTVFPSAVSWIITIQPPNPSTGLDLLPQFQSQHISAALGQNIGLRLQLVDPLSGLASLPLTLLTTVTGT